MFAVGMTIGVMVFLNSPPFKEKKLSDSAKYPSFALHLINNLKQEKPEKRLSAGEAIEFVSKNSMGHP
jgi:hypothetical protein